MKDGQSGEINVQLLDEWGIVHQYYDENKTAQIIARDGNCSGFDGRSVNFNLTITQVINDGTPLLVNGEGIVVFEGSESDFKIEDVAFIKDIPVEDYEKYDYIPKSGTMRIMIDGIEVTIVFGGTTKVQLHFSYNGQYYTIIIDLANNFSFRGHANFS